MPKCIKDVRASISWWWWLNLNTNTTGQNQWLHHLVESLDFTLPSSQTLIHWLSRFVDVSWCWRFQLVQDLQCILLHTPAIARSRTKLAQGQTLHTYLVTEVHIFSSPFNIGSKRSKTAPALYYASRSVSISSGKVIKTKPPVSFSCYFWAWVVLFWWKCKTRQHLPRKRECTASHLCWPNSRSSNNKSKQTSAKKAYKPRTYRYHRP